jgi:hypothetical protein
VSARRHRQAAVLLALALGVLLAGMVPGASAAAGRLLEFELRASHGYRLFVDAQGATATLTTTRAKHDARTGSLSSYIARRGPGGGAIRATFGNLGSVAMRFRPNGVVTYSKARKGCIGPDRFTIQHGTFVGSLRFRGEEGYTAVKVSRVAGQAVSPHSLICTGSRVSARPQISAAPQLSAGAQISAAARQPSFRFEAGYRSGLFAEYFEATRTGEGRARFLVNLEQTVGRLAIRRLAIGSGRARTFATDNALSFATIAPNAPFAGTGSLTRDALGARLWSGSLTVSFPGAPGVPLTGPLFKTGLSRSFTSSASRLR